MKNKIINFKELDELALYVYKFLEKGGTLGIYTCPYKVYYIFLKI